jgi:hypothetical protein
MKLSFKNNLKTTLVLDLIFTEGLNWTTADVQAFVLMSEDDPLIDIPLHMDVTYSIVSPKIYRIELTPKGYIFIYNSNFTFKSIPNDGVLRYSINGVPFMINVYDQTVSGKWFLIKTPGLSDM